MTTTPTTTTIPTMPTMPTMELVASSMDIEDAIPSGVQFSPDGLCILTSVRDEFRLYNRYDTPTPTTASATASMDDDPTLEPQQPEEEQQQPPLQQDARPWSAALRCKGGDIVQSYDWYPHMSSLDAGTCCFVGTSREQPIHLYDAYYAGMIRATYVPIHPERDEVVSPMMVKFDATGTKLVCGGYTTDRLLHVFDVTRPGRDSLVCYKLGKTRRSQDGQKGLVSSLACATKSTNLIAVGTYSPGSIYLYDMRMSGEEGVATVLHGGVSVVGHGKRVKRFPVMTDTNDSDNNGTDSIFSFAKAQWYQKRAQMGITQLDFCQSDHALLSASRKSDAVLKWDIRMMTAPECAIQPICGVQSYAVNHSTNQRMQFHVHRSTQNHNDNANTNNDCGDDTLVSIGDRTNNMVQVYNVVTGTLVETIEVGDVPNGVSVHSDCMAVSLGERQFRDDETMICQGSIQLLRRR